MVRVSRSSGQMHSWSQKSILAELRRLNRDGEEMWSRKIRETHSALYAAAINWMGSYSQAVAAAGIDYTKVRRMEHGRWNQKTVAAELKKLHRSRTPMHHAAMERQRPELVVAAYRYFDSYQSAIEAAGLDYADIRIRTMPSWDRKRVVRELKDLRKQKHGLWKRALRRTQPYLERAAKKHFGSYERAAKASGIPACLLQPPPYRSWSPDRVTLELRELYQRGPQLLKPARIGIDNPKLVRACRRRFGTYAKALGAAGIPYSRVARTTKPPLAKDQIVKMLARMFDHGVDLRYSAMYKKNARLVDAARGRFGSYGQAVEAAGIDYPPAPQLRHWTARNVLAAMRKLHHQGKDLRFRQFRSQHLPLFEAARHYFGTYLEAVKRAKIDYDEMVQQQLNKQLPNRRRVARA